jgi:hypothetical protein
MVYGISGGLLSSTFLDQMAAGEFVNLRGSNDMPDAVLRWWKRVDRALGPASSVRRVADACVTPLLESRGYRILSLEPHGDGLSGVITSDRHTPVVIRIVPWNTDPDVAWRNVVRAGRSTEARWAMVFTGNKIRIVDAERTWSRRALDIDLAAALGDERGAIVLMKLLDAVGTASGDRALTTLTSRSDARGRDVCTALGSGVLDALTALFGELGRSRRSPVDSQAAFEQALTVVYRLLFLLFAEARALVPVWHHVYRDAYTIDSLCRRMLATRRPPGLWKAIQAIARLAHHGCRAGDLVVTPFNGRLFSPKVAPLAEYGRVSDAAVAHAIESLTTTGGKGGRERIAYTDLGVEQLGAVYERVLEYRPDAAAPSPRLTRTSLERKATGSFYTPRSVTDFLVRRALHPLVAGRTADEILRLRVLDPAMGSGAFLVAACRFLSAAAGRALIDEGALAPDAWPAEKRALRRLVAERCLFGVDLNPMAVQLARLSLWLASLSADRPLTFLDHHLVMGDSLIGASFAELSREPFASLQHQRTFPLLEIDPAVAFASTVLPERFRLTLGPSDTPADVQGKELALAQLNAPGAPLTRWKQAANLWCAAWLWPKHSSEPGIPDELTRGVYRDVFAGLIAGSGQLADHQRSAILQRVAALALTHRFFHWPLEFPEVFCSADGRPDPDGGFDAVLGNPPWEVLRADAGDRATRTRARETHRTSRRFFAHARVYRHQGQGHTNRYQLFVERSLQLTRPGGRIALILPGGLAIDQGCAHLRRALFAETEIERLTGFDNRGAIFPIHRDMRFFLLTATKGPPTRDVTCSFGQSDAQWLDELPDDAREDPPRARPVRIAIDTVKMWDPEHVALPWITCTDDLAIVSLLEGGTPRLSAADGWNIRFGRELNATDDRRHFAPLTAARARGWLPVVEGKHLSPFQIQSSKCTLAIPRARAATLLDAERTYDRARLGYREVASASNRLTLIAARLAAGIVSTHTVFCSKDTLGTDAQYCLLALLNSLVANYLVRLRVHTHVTASAMARLRVPRPRPQTHAFKRLAVLARTLEHADYVETRPEYAEINAIAAWLYGISRDQYARVVDTFPLLPAEVRRACIAAYEREPRMATQM